MLLLLLLWSLYLTHAGDDRGYMARQILDLLPPRSTRAASAADSEDPAVIAEAALPAIMPETVSIPQSAADRPQETDKLREYLRQHSHVTGKCNPGTCYVPGNSDSNNNDVSVATTEKAPLPKIISLGNGNYYTDILCASDIPDVETTYMTCYVRMPTDK
jgi:hypothetical protein